MSETIEALKQKAAAAHGKVEATRAYAQEVARLAREHAMEPVIAEYDRAIFEAIAGGVAPKDLAEMFGYKTAQQVYEAKRRHGLRSAPAGMVESAAESVIETLSSQMIPAATKEDVEARLRARATHAGSSKPSLAYVENAEATIATAQEHDAKEAESHGPMQVEETSLNSDDGLGMMGVRFTLEDWEYFKACVEFPAEGHPNADPKSRVATFSGTIDALGIPTHPDTPASRYVFAQRAPVATQAPADIPPPPPVPVAPAIPAFPAFTLPGQS